MLRSTIRIWPLAVFALGCFSDPPTLTDCETQGPVTPVCGFSNPEDLALIPGTSWILVSEFARPEEAGGLVGFRSVDGRQRRLYPDGPDEGRLSSDVSQAGWGDPSCPGPPDAAVFAPHGIDLRSRDQGAGEVAVVNHGREAIELFEVGYAGGGPALGWRGCVPVPAGMWANDVAFAPGGALVFTNMMPPVGTGPAMWAGVKLLIGVSTGSVIRWDPGSGNVEIANSEGSGPNGIAVSRDGSEVFFTEWGASRLVRLRPGGEPERVEIDLPHRGDNLSWARDGRLLVAGQEARLGEVLACADVEAGTCAVAYSVVAVEPTSLDSEVVFAAEGGSMGAVSSALHVGGELFLGTFAGDRIARLRFPD